ncbi:hypothetical protein FRX31_022540 [Thalictrum thalictroides]|uniref:Uncharacterized protein n=1 Tax=Thalictrum thalictroides TaxID=46969 RepID=A0A7J6VS00_THATH|nr:hypothetical protein FRX31_022540 [Thalictrum thalictroides]
MENDSNKDMKELYNASLYHLHASYANKVPGTFSPSVSHRFIDHARRRAKCQNRVVLFQMHNCCKSVWYNGYMSTSPISFAHFGWYTTLDDDDIKNLQGKEDPIGR